MIAREAGVGPGDGMGSTRVAAGLHRVYQVGSFSRLFASDMLLQQYRMHEAGTRTYAVPAACQVPGVPPSPTRLLLAYRRRPRIRNVDLASRLNLSFCCHHCPSLDRELAKI